MWLVTVGAGFAGLNRYAATTGSADAPSVDVAEMLATHRRPGHPLAVMMIHPKCPCTDASLAEFADFLARAGSACDGLLVQLAPLDAGADWQSGPTRVLGGRTVAVVNDFDGRVAASLGAQTSGHVVLLDEAGAVRFHGGITLARGHRGRSPGQDAMLAAVAHRSAAVELCGAPVYGCPLQNETPRENLSP
ncbi:MAG TPA: hypothetical protein VHF69_04710 [Candidatus Synoicihabitans sp.]|nr:hypothetical protein [Candidatus Synoicihabitans sp.]